MVNVPMENRKLIDAAEAARMINSATTLKDKSILALYYITGIRAKEAFSIKKEDIWQDSKFLYIRISREKRRKDIIIPMPAVLPITLSATHIELIIEQWQSSAPEQPVWFYSSNLETSRNHVWRMIKKTNPNAWTHLFRHSRNEFFRKKGYSKEKRMAFMGWTDSRTPDRYSHPNEKDVEELGGAIE